MFMCRHFLPLKKYLVLEEQWVQHAAEPHDAPWVSQSSHSFQAPGLMRFTSLGLSASGDMGQNFWEQT